MEQQNETKEVVSRVSSVSSISSDKGETNDNATKELDPRMVLGVVIFIALCVAILLSLNYTKKQLSQFDDLRALTYNPLNKTYLFIFKTTISVYDINGNKLDYTIDLPVIEDTGTVPRITYAYFSNQKLYIGTNNDSSTDSTTIEIWSLQYKSETEKYDLTTGWTRPDDSNDNNKQWVDKWNDDVGRGKLIGTHVEHHTDTDVDNSTTTTKFTFTGLSNLDGVHYLYTDQFETSETIVTVDPIIITDPLDLQYIVGMVHDPIDCKQLIVYKLKNVKKLQVGVYNSNNNTYDQLLQDVDSGNTKHTLMKILRIF